MKPLTRIKSAVIYQGSPSLPLGDPDFCQASCRFQAERGNSEESTGRVI